MTVQQNTFWAQTEKKIVHQVYEEVQSIFESF